MYVDGFLLPLPTKNLAAYRRMAKISSRVWRQHGALAYHECIGDDLVHKGVVAFPKAARCKRRETVVLAWIIYKSRAHRDKVNAKVLKDPRIAKMMNPAKTPFDCKRMAYGGFKTLVRA